MSSYQDNAAKFNASQNGIRALNEQQTTLTSDIAIRVHRIHDLLQGQTSGGVNSEAKDGASARPTLLEVMERKTYHLMDISETVDAIEHLLGIPSSQGLRLDNHNGAKQEGQYR